MLLLWSCRSRTSQRPDPGASALSPRESPSVRCRFSGRSCYRRRHSDRPPLRRRPPQTPVQPPYINLLYGRGPVPSHQSNCRSVVFTLLRRLLRSSGGSQDQLLLLGLLLSSSSVLISGLDGASVSDRTFEILCSVSSTGCVFKKRTT